MPALSPPGLADDSGHLQRQQTSRESASPTRPAVDKSTRSRAVYSLISDVFSINTLVNSTTTLEHSSASTTFLTLVTPSPANHQSEVTGERDRPAVGPPARYCRQAGRPPGTVRGRQPRTAQVRPASSGGLPPTWKTERTGRPTGRPSPAVLLRWSA